MTALLEASYPKARLAEIVLEPTTEEHLQRIIKEQRNFAKIQAYGLSPRRKILLVGPPGTGKTLTSSVLAGLLCGAVAFLVQGALDTNFYSLQLSAMFWLFLGMIQAVSHPKNAESKP